MPDVRRAQPRTTAYEGEVAPSEVEGQCVPRSRPVSFYDNFKVTSAMPPCVASAMSVGNLSQVRDSVATPTIPQNNNRVSSAVSAGNVAKIHSPKMTGAVSTGNIGKTFRLEKEKERELGRAPSMANCLSTTVPVNLAASQIAGRHTPTRNSLRHSRMIVMHRTVPRKSQPPLLRHRRLARSLAALQTILGVAITSLSLWLLLWAPNLPVTDNPYWSGMPLLLSGSFGICLLCCFKKEYPGMSPGFCLTTTKVISVFLASLASIACFVACIASALHLARLTGLECIPARVLNATCACRVKNETMDSTSEPVLRYVDLNCPEVESILTILLIFSASSNGLGAIVAGWYCYLHWSTRNKRPKYVQVRTNPSSTNNFVNRPIYNPNLNGR
ncbi:uncharacterized protein LOC105699130 isoform X2 [Orussus abietinus]|uniref:uncharacterized protein LOC105699130 isoform X2 n=1 Tax=Orussus abietinus TaxID=222816 RepID=UPI000C715F19|nr:uncharacterized protein LOC105699130 isoform X2 [Orussus abietinus]